MAHQDVEKTLSAYVLAGELSRPLIIVKFGYDHFIETGRNKAKNLTQIFKTAVQEKSDCFA